MARQYYENNVLNDDIFLDADQYSNEWGQFVDIETIPFVLEDRGSLIFSESSFRKGKFPKEVETPKVENVTEEQRKKQSSFRFTRRFSTKNRKHEVIPDHLEFVVDIAKKTYHMDEQPHEESCSEVKQNGSTLRRCKSSDLLHPSILKLLVALHPVACNNQAMASRLVQQYTSADRMKKEIVLDSAIGNARNHGKHSLLNELPSFCI